MRSLLRVLAALVVGGALVGAAQTAPDWHATLGGRDGGALAAGTRAAPTSAALVCPGPETIGVAGVPDAAGTRRPDIAYAAPGPMSLAPRDEGLPPADQVGEADVSATAVPGAALPISVVPGNVVSRAAGTVGPDPAHASAAQPTAVAVAARGLAATGLAAAQLTLVDDGDLRGLTGATCAPPSAESWLVAGGGEEGRRGRIVLTNPGANPVSVDVDVVDDGGPVDAPAGRGVTVPARGRTVLLLDALAPGASAPAVHVVAHGGVVAAVLHDSRLDGTTPRGADDAVPAAPAARRVLVPGVVLTGHGGLRIVSPGAEEAVVQVRLVGPSGSVRPAGAEVVRVPGHSTHDMDLSDLPAGAWTVELTSDVPVTAGAWVERARDGKDGPADLAWTSAAPPLSRLGAVPVVRSTVGWTTSLVLGAARGFAVVEVVHPGDHGPEVDTVRVEAGHTVQVPLGGASPEWVRVLDGTGEVSAARVTTYAGTRGELVTASPVTDVPLDEQQPVVRPAG